MSTKLRLAANGYADLYTLLHAGEVEFLDFIKCPLSPDGRAEVTRARTYRPVLLHGWGPPGFSATSASIPEAQVLRKVAQVSGSPWLSVHLDVNPERDGEMTANKLLARVKENVERLAEISGLPVLLENVPHYAGRPKPLLGSDPAFISEAVQASGAGFLLDTAHARVAAFHRKQDEEAYLLGLPLHQTREIHTSGPRLEGQGLTDRHLTLQTEDWVLLRWLLPRTPEVEILTHEYMGLRPNTTPYTDSHGPTPLKEDLLILNAVRHEFS